MSVVCSEILCHTDTRNVEHKLKSYALDDRFYLEMNRFSVMGGSVGVRMNFSVDEAKILKRQLEEFIKQNI